MRPQLFQHLHQLMHSEAHCRAQLETQPQANTHQEGEELPAGFGDLSTTPGAALG